MFYYHILLDVMIGFKNKLESSNLTIGKLRNTLTKLNGISITTDFDDALNISNRMIDIAVKNGSLDIHLDRGVYPVFGAIILKINIDSPIVTNINILNETGERDYNLLTFNNNDVLLYNANKYQRGLINKDSIHKLNIVSAYYNVKIDVPETIGFSLFNMCLKYENVCFLKSLYNNKNSFVDFPQLVQSGGKNKLYKIKKEYINLKKKYNHIIA